MIQSQTNNNIFSGNAILIALVVTVLFLSLFGINIFFLFGVIIEAIYNFFKPIIIYILSFFTYIVGLFIYKTADIVKDTSKIGIDITGNAVEDVGKVLMKASQNEINTKVKVNLDEALKKKKESFVNFSENNSSNLFENKKNGWSFDSNEQYAKLDETDKIITCNFNPSSAICLNK